MARKTSTRKADAAKTGLVNRKVSPKLRLFANGDEEVCLARAENEPALAVTDETVLEAMPLLRAEATTRIRRRKHDVGHIRRPISTAKASVFVQMTENEDRGRGAPVDGEARRRTGIVTAEIPLDEIADLAERPDVVNIEAGDLVRVPPVILSEPADGRRKPTISERRITTLSRKHRYGADVLVGIIDVGGIAFAHDEFLNDGETRVCRIWDMGGDVRPPPDGFDYGAEFRGEHLNAAIRTAGEIGVSPYAIEPQKHMQRGSHGTHVASIAAGKTGICRNAAVACVTIDLAPEDLDRRRSFYDSVRVAHAMDYLIDVAEELGKERGLPGPVPLTVNISLGTNGHAHDGSSAISRWIDNALVRPGRIVSVAVGNAVQEAPEFPGDLGFVMGRIHSSGRIAARGLTNTLDWVVVGDGIADVSENEMEVWYEAQDRFSVTVYPPGSSSDPIGPVRPGEYVENRQLSDGTFISVYNELYRPANGANTIAIYLTPRLKEPLIGVASGEWRIALHGEDVRDGRYHVWIERDDPRPRHQRKGVLYSAYPSFFSMRSNTDAYSVSSLACGERILSVGNYDERGRKVNASSSQGPTRLERTKPEVLAPGTAILAANGFAGPDDPYVAMTGTSMASPYVAGVAGLMLAVNPNLTAAQIIGILRRTARPVDDSDYAWQDDRGFGLITPEAAVEEADTVDDRNDIT